MELPKLSIISNNHILCDRPFIYEVNIQQVPQFNYEYHGYNIGKLKCIHNHPIDQTTYNNNNTGISTWYPSMMVLTRFHKYAKRKRNIYFRCTVSTLTILISLILYISLTAQTEHLISDQYKFYFIVFLLLIEYTIILAYGSYIIYSKFHDKTYIISLTNGTTDETLLEYRKELVHSIDMANVPDHGHIRYQIEKKYQISR